MLYGATTRNGKGTLMETFLRLMGDYGATMRPESLGMQSLRTGSAPSEDLARLSGVRFVNISEPDEHLQLSASLVKTLTGRDTVTARFLHQNSFEYRPQFKLFINTNHLPQVTDHTLFDSGRVQLLPFERHFEPQEQDRGLKAELARPWLLSCALKWCFDGLRALREDGFSLGETPDCARRALLRYRADSDQVGQFARECLLPREGGAVKASQVYAAYGDWCSQNGLQRESAIAFHRQLERWYRMTRGRLDGSNTTKIFTGCELVENHEYS